MGSDRSDLTDYGGDYTSVAPVELKERMAEKPYKRSHHRLFLLAVPLYAILMGIAIVLSSISLKHDAEQREALLVSNCVQTNVSRRNTYESLMTLAILSVQARSQPATPVSPLVQRYVDYLNQAFDPMDCDPDSELFGVDPTPPPPLPVNEFFPGSPYSSTTTTAVMPG